MAAFARSNDLRGAEFTGADLRGAKFAQTDLSGVVMRGSMRTAWTSMIRSSVAAGACASTAWR